MPAPLRSPSETMPLLTPSSSNVSLARNVEHEHNDIDTGKGGRNKKAAQRTMDETHDDNYRPEWAPNPRDDKEKSRPRTLIVCFDGTGDQFDADNSNVVQFLSFLMKNDPKHQLVYYQAGIGTYNDAGFVTNVMSQLSKTLDSMFAWNLASHVQDGYHFLMQNYRAGDRISIFGFSRGAYTARALAGMIQRVGLLPAGNARQIPFAWSMYTREDEKAKEESKNFKKTFSANVIIDFVGVWDTVASVGLVNKELPFVRNNTAIRVFRHALALDEHRVKFLPNYYHGPAVVAGLDSASEPAPAPASAPAPKDSSADKSADKKSIYPTKERDTPTDACEVWFAGCHCDVGGGSVSNETTHSLARIPLRWMIRECYRMKTGIVFDKKRLESDLGMDMSKLYPNFEPRGKRVTAEKYSEARIKPRSTPEGNSIVSFLKAIPALVWLPVGILYNILSWPFKYIWYFITGKFSKEPAEQDAQMTSQKDKLSEFKTEEDHEFYDALAPIYDQLQIKWYWKIMEYIPMRTIEQRRDGDETYICCNKGLGRNINDDACHATDSAGANERCSSCKAPTGLSAKTYNKAGGLKIHRSVLTRLEASGKGETYEPLARYEKKNGWCNKDMVGPVKWEWVE